VVASGIAHCPEGRRVFAYEVEKISTGGYLRTNPRRDRRTRFGFYAEFPRLAERSKQADGTLSGRRTTNAGLGRAMMSRPRLICSSEPSLGLRPNSRANFCDHPTHRDAGTDGMLVEQTRLRRSRCATTPICWKRPPSFCPGLARDDRKRASAKRPTLADVAARNGRCCRATENGCRSRAQPGWFANHRLVRVTGVDLIGLERRRVVRRERMCPTNRLTSVSEPVGEDACSVRHVAWSTL